MPDLRNKTILIISPQDWGKMFISKHHYAIALAKRGNEVYFLNPPDNFKWQVAGKSKRIRIEKLNDCPGLNLIWHQLYFPYRIKFHAKPVYDFLMKKQVKDILSVIEKPVDIVWSFDLGHLYPFYLFGENALKIFHPVDEPAGDLAIRSAEGADIIFSVTKEILGRYRHLNIPSYFVNHGLSEEFLFSGTNNYIPSAEFLQIGMSGNLLRTDLDRETLLQIVRENPDLVFNFFGSYTPAQSNIGGGDDHHTQSFIISLRSLPNVVLHGTLTPGELARELQKMDALLICYDIKSDQSKGTNYHKIMEYLSTGKAIVANNITTYEKLPDLIRMTESRENNNELPALFKETICCIEKYNDPSLQQKRIGYAKENTYSMQLEKIDKLLSQS